jgi:hypothetical protein
MYSNLQSSVANTMQYIREARAKFQKDRLTSIFYVDKTEVSICLESHFWTLVTDY